MGRPYQSEMAKLPATYAWGHSQCIRSLSQIVGSFTAESAICIGSGGSYSAAILCAEVLEAATGKLATARTPLEIEASPIPEKTSIWLLSGSGRNVDIRRALKIAAQHVDLQIVIVCAKTNSPLEREARALGISTIFSFDSPAGKDGFLATNSLLATCLLLTRAADDVTGVAVPLPCTLSALYETFVSGTTGRQRVSEAAEAMAKSSYSVVLHGPSGRVGAMDLESKFIEAALAPLAPSDYRNFAHGRHNWLNRFAESTYVLALVADNERKLAEKTISLLPDHVGRTTLSLPSSSNAARLASLLLAFDITAIAGTALNLDPGRPKIPEFGRKLYRVRTGLSQRRKSQAQNPAVQRKLSAGGLGDHATELQLSNYARAHEKFVKRLQDTLILAVVFDYDGTLVATDQRESPPPPSIMAEINRLLDAGIAIRIATGRGNSISDPLKDMITPTHCDQICIGYHNGAVCHLLKEPLLDDDQDAPESEDLVALCDRLNEKLPFLAIDEIRSYRHQLSLRGCSESELARVWAITNELIVSEGLNDLKVMTSGHSVDVLDKNISKLNVLEQLANELDIGFEQILCIGDSGHWPGNDFELLSSPLSLSVDRVSVNLDSCWNLLPARVAHVDGTLYYLRKLKADQGHARMTL